MALLPPVANKLFEREVKNIKYISLDLTYHDVVQRIENTI